MTDQGRQLAAENIARARAAYLRYVEASEVALNAFETSAARAAGLMGVTLPAAAADGPDADSPTARGWAAMRAMAQTLFVATDTNMRAGFSFASKLVQAEDARAAIDLQSRYLQEQSERFAHQMLDLQRTALRAAGDVARGTGAGPL
ncbi:phasin family protein [Methylobacterium radiodurans]|uniref:Phasin domain-containing protein n=1 Tax=Methylobacterium radiodurans TaxID=2202828 RepID=A0A2U8VNM6_9HYPH|nr:phasin family protein [Methylobacterium radiodurans]AWN35234.1 hypothetical protein DK427_05365 [Methylobacterium radiodurans]